ncbi:MAG: dehydrogenase, partial [Verrucomicrobiae bacterium]|nr:dehydrogenase [Verrucomicrobiae bacterium]
MESGPLSPEEAMKTIHVPEGYMVELIAAEPLVLDPVAFDWDAEGRLWVVEMADYPLGLGDDQAAGGRIRVLEDVDGDGTMDRSSLYAEGLNFPNGILHWRDGVIVTAAPDVLFLQDTNGDGKADKQEVLLTGLLEGNQQLRANGLRWGLDNWVYVAAGGHHGNYGVDTMVRSTRAGIDVKVGSRDFRFRPDTGELEPQSGPTQFGRNRDDWGNWFGTQNSRPLWHYVLPDHYVRRNPYFSPAETRVLLPNQVNPPVYPAKPPQKRFHNFQQSGHFTSACSGMIYRDGYLLDDEATNGFTCEPFHNLVQRIRLTHDGVTFHGERAGGENEPDFFASSDRWCRPVMVRTGPDGALWIADMYRYMIEHPQWLPQNGKDELLPHYREGDDKGRIWRVVKSSHLALRDEH